MKREDTFEFQAKFTPETLHEALDVLSGELLGIVAILNGAYAMLCSYSAGDLPDDWRKPATIGATQEGIKLCLDRARHLSELADMDWHKLPPGKSQWAEIEAQQKKEGVQP